MGQPDDAGCAFLNGSAVAGGAIDRFCGSIAAAVDQGIGPQRALTLASAAAAFGTADRDDPPGSERRLIEAHIVAAERG